MTGGLFVASPAVVARPNPGPGSDPPCGATLPREATSVRGWTGRRVRGMYTVDMDREPWQSPLVEDRFPRLQGVDGIPPTASSQLPARSNSQLSIMPTARSSTVVTGQGVGLAAELGDSVVIVWCRRSRSMRRRAFSFHGRAVVWFVCGFEHQTHHEDLRCSDRGPGGSAEPLSTCALDWHPCEPLVDR